MRETGRAAFTAAAVDLTGAALWVGPDRALGPATRARLAAELGAPPDLQLTRCSLRDLPTLCCATRVPCLVAAPLFWPEGDVLDTLRVLALLGYPGPVRVAAPPLPRPDIVRRELRADSPGLDIELVEVPGHEAPDDRTPDA
jgi:hypothetical protein